MTTLPAASVRVTFAAEVVRREPSKEQAEKLVLPAHWLFGSESGDVPAFGSAIHSLFEKIEWMEDANLEKIIAEWRAGASGTAKFLSDVEQQFRSCVSHDEVRKLLSKPAGPVRAEVWREAPFDLVLETDDLRHIVSGRFDRLVVERDGAGRPVRAAVCDFKSNRVESEDALRQTADGYAGQMADYARAAGRLLDLPFSQIDKVLLFTRTGRVWRC
jgi:hypothetical protein